ncbi:hypothetical protein TWF718_009792 [Orbilia javanica]|uniref:Uncharacterized protein n=1 Tax=Orbilia javanica TaxID=47235 RepID=A0AAN8MZX5_9PEZI
MAVVKRLRFFFAFVLSATTFFALISGQALLPENSQHQHRQRQQAGRGLISQSHKHAGQQSPLGEWAPNTIKNLPETFSEGIAIVDWKSYVDASRYNYALNHWESLKNDPEMVDRYGAHGPSAENMLKVLCLVDSSSSDGESQTIETSECTWEEVHDPRPSQRWHIRYKYLEEEIKSSSGDDPRWIASIRNGRSDRCAEATNDSGLGKARARNRRSNNAIDVLKLGPVVSSECQDTNQESRKGLEFIIQRCTNSQPRSNREDIDDMEEIFRNWSLCISPSYESLATTTDSENLSQNPCSDPSLHKNLIHALDKPSSVGWGCGPNTWYFPTQALHAEKGEHEWQQL